MIIKAEVYVLSKLEKIFKTVFAGYIGVLVFFVLVVGGVSIVSAAVESVLVALALVIGSKYTFILRGRLGFNLGGFLVPLIFSIEIYIRSYVLFSMISVDFLTALIISTLVCYFASLKVHHAGVFVNLVAPLFVVPSLSSIIVLRHTIPVYYSAIISLLLGYLSVLIGVDILNYDFNHRRKYVIGGEGLLDALVVVTFLSAGVSLAISLVTSVA